ncbi:helix-turn-helix domain-containing protein [Burkholderia sp. LS-044]|uniref:helix-turn-helix domain-containing protein n=1 Tax=Burkholderia sp. LS-044 TaxID=1459967 RepID=UPI001FFF8CA5|nr:helix-turn-helix domain-containing protein [Burkholderia sp. LS-044]
MTKYKHLSAEERVVIMIQKARNTSVRAIARLLGRNASTTTLELARNRTETPRCYDATSAASANRTRRKRSRRQAKLTAGSILYWQVHHDLVYRCRSPQQIAARLCEMNPDNPEQRVSHEKIYAATPRGSLKQAMIEALRQEKPGVATHARHWPAKALCRKIFASSVGPRQSKLVNGPVIEKAISSRGPSIVPASAH